MSGSIKFLGAAQTVTGSRTLIEYRNKKILVDCGLFQGPKEIRSQNWEILKDADSIDLIVLTHAHIDHSGYLPRIFKDGFKGRVLSTPGTFELCKILLPDSGRLQEEDAEFANREGYSDYAPALPLYTEEDALLALKFFKTLHFNKWHELQPGLSLRFLRAGHILGSSIVQFMLSDESEGSKIITFSGDLGNSRSYIMQDPEWVTDTHDLVLESTYGDRMQKRINPMQEVASIVNKVLERGGTLVIPAFAVGRTQEILYILHALEEKGAIKKFPVFLDSPMAEAATEIYASFPEEIKSNINPLDSFNFATHNFKAIKSADESMLLCMDDTPKIIISAAGMLTGGRVLHHLKAQLPKEKSGVLFVGYQAVGTKGLLLKNGFKEIRIHHKEVSVEAEIFSIDSLSAHADSSDLVAWVKKMRNPPQRVFLNHGEINSMQTLKYRLKIELGIKEIYLPKAGEVFSI